MKKVKRILGLLILIFLAAETYAQQFSKADQSIIANYPITLERVNQYMNFEKGFAAAKASEPKYGSLTPPRTLDEKINLLSQLPSFVKLAKNSGTNLRDITLTGASLHILFAATDPKKQASFKRMCDMGYAERPSTDQLAFAEVHRSDLVQWQKQIVEYGKAELVK
jgi:hypothetical protein